MNIEAKIYANAGNHALIALVDESCQRLLDVGCGDGANARLLKTSRPGIYIEGITHTPEEVSLAEHSMGACFLADIEDCMPSDLSTGFDTVLFSHVLEHLRSPEQVLPKFLQLLKPGGQVLFAVPNIVAWRTRWRLLKGDFQYEAFGVFDNTHLRFFTYRTAASYILSQCENIERVRSTVEGSVPLGPLRKLLPRSLCTWFDITGCRLYPNLFGNQVIVDARTYNG